MLVFYNPAFWALAGTITTSIITASVTYKVALANASKEVSIKREEFVDQHMKTILDTYQKEVMELRTDISKLIKENQLLREEVVSLRGKIIELEGFTNEKQGK